MAEDIHGAIDGMEPGSERKGVLRVRRKGCGWMEEGKPRFRREPCDPARMLLQALCRLRKVAAWQSGRHEKMRSDGRVDNRLVEHDAHWRVCLDSCCAVIWREGKNLGWRTRAASQKSGQHKSAAQPGSYTPQAEWERGQEGSRLSRSP